jgi:hypothetical protein
MNLLIVILLVLGVVWFFVSLCIFREIDKLTKEEIKNRVND